MRIAGDVLGPVREPYLEGRHEHTIDMLLRSGFIEVGRRRSEVRRLKFEAGEVGLCTRHTEHWLGNSDMQRLSFCISEAALMTAGDGAVKLSPKCTLVDARISALSASVNAERIAGFPSGPLLILSARRGLRGVRNQKHRWAAQWSARSLRHTSHIFRAGRIMQLKTLFIF